MKIINLLDKDVTVVTDNGKTIQIKKDSGLDTPKIDKKSIKLPENMPLGKNWELPIYHETQGRVLNLPSEEKEVFYLVDREVARACRRGDICYLGDTIKRKGKVIGHKGLVFSVVRAALADFMYG